MSVYQGVRYTVRSEIKERRTGAPGPRCAPADTTSRVVWPRGVDLTAPPALAPGIGSREPPSSGCETQAAREPDWLRRCSGGRLTPRRAGSVEAWLFCVVFVVGIPRNLLLNGAKSPQACQASVSSAPVAPHLPRRSPRRLAQPHPDPP